MIYTKLSSRRCVEE